MPDDTAATTTTTTATGTATGGAGDPFYQPYIGKLDKDTLSWLDGKKFGGVEDALKSGASAERMFRDRNVISKPDPTKLTDWEGWSSMGYDADRAKYGAAIKPPKMPNDGKHDAELFDTFVNLAHEAKLPPSLAEKVFQGLSDKVMARLSEVGANGVKARETLDAQLRGEWGEKYGEKLELGQRAAKAFGFGADDLSELEKITGSPNLLKRFAAMGEKLGEGNLVQNDGLGGAGTTPASAMAEMRRLEGNPEWFKVFKDSRHPQNADYKAQWQRLAVIAAKDPKNVTPQPRGR